MSYDPALLHPATLHAKAPETFQVKFVTTAGDFVVEVHRDWAPIGADRFYNLVHHHFYDGAAFFRAIPGFVVQFGLSAHPAVGKAWQRANIKDDPVTRSNKPGTLTFATAGPNTRTTQLFINLGDNAQLDSQGFAAFAQVASGMNVVQKIYTGYGDTGGTAQDGITTQGEAYVQKHYPKMDSIKTATIISPATPSGPVHHHPTSGGSSH